MKQYKFITMCAALAFAFSTATIAQEKIDSEKETTPTEQFIEITKDVIDASIDATKEIAELFKRDGDFMKSLQKIENHNEAREIFENKITEVLKKHNLNANEYQQVILQSENDPELRKKLDEAKESVNKK